MKFELLVFCICLTSMQLVAQQDTVSKKTTLTAVALYSSNVSYYGQSTNEALPYVLVNATLRIPIGLFFSAGAYKLLNYGSGLSETDLGIGYDRDVSDKLNLGISYTRSFFPSNSPLLQASNTNNLNLSASYLLPVFKSGFNADYAFGKQKDVFLSLNTSKEVILGNFFSDKNIFFIEPAFELVAGTRHFYESYTISKGKREQSKGKVPQNPGISGSAKNTVSTIENSNFNLLSYNFKLPLSFSRADYIAELSYQFSILGKADETLKKQQSFFGVAFYYQF